MDTTKEITDKKALLRILLSGLAVVLAAFILVVIANAMMNTFLDAELESVQIAAQKAEEARLAAEAIADEKLRQEAEMKAKIAQYDQMEAFYQQYKNRDCYHYYGQFYEMFNNVYEADTIFIGTSHCSHGINPLYIEDEITNRSFFNFGLNGTVPSYYRDWYKVFKEEAQYPLPDTIIYCVDWFMTDTGWLWRRIDFDTPDNMALGVMRSLKKKTSSSKKAETAVTEDTQSDKENTVTDDAVREKTLSELLGESIRKNGWWNIEEHTTVLMLNTPIFSERDRIPEVLSFYFHGMRLPEQENVTPDAEAVSPDAEETETLAIPTYTHKKLIDASGNITSDYYKGYIPWDVGFGGGRSNVKFTDNPSEWKSFIRLLNEFLNDGINIIFVEIPEYSGRISKDMDERNAMLDEIAEQYDITFLNYNDELASDFNDDPSNYSDWGHMNKKGSTAFSKILAQDLKPLLAEFDKQ